MKTDRITVAPGVELAADRWTPSPAGRAAGDEPGATFLLVHGLASNARMWDGVAEALVAMGHPVVTVDLRGHGRSSKPDDGYDVPRVADDLATLIARLDLDRPIAAGQSWGGNVVLELAARHPAAVRGDRPGRRRLDRAVRGLPQAGRLPRRARPASPGGPAAHARWMARSARRMPIGPRPASRARSATSRSGRTAPSRHGSRTTATWSCCAACGSTIRRRSTRG